MKEEWKEVDDFPGYEVSNKGRVRSYWEKVKTPNRQGGNDRILRDKPVRLIKASDDGNGYLKVYLQNDNKRTCKKVHRLVAEAFIDHEPEADTVDHIRSGREGKLINSVENLRWISRRENIQKAYRDGMCDERIRNSRKLIVVYDSWADEQITFYSLGDAARFVGVHYTTLSHAINTEKLVRRRYYIEEPLGEDRMLYDER